VAHVSTGPFRGGRDDRVQHVTPGCDDKVDPGLELDRPTDRVTKGVERDLPDGRGAAVQDRIEETPAAELDDAAARDRVSRYGVAREQCLVHDHHVMPETSEQHGGS
jgi:hypothetical protein